MRVVCIGAKAHPAPRDFLADIVLTHQVIGSGHARTVFDHQANGGVLRGFAALAGDLPQSLAGQRLQYRVF